MPNLLQIESLRAKYQSHNNVNQKQIKLLKENFRFSTGTIKNQFAIAGTNDNLVDYFESQQSADVVLLFIDITGFSTKCSTLSNAQLSTYLDNYYDQVIATIYRHGGEVEKIIGDGIICIFGQPFLNATKEKLFEKADACAKDIILDLMNTDKEVKIAMHDGTISYYKNKTENYPEYTMIGRPLTELFRLEGVSENNSINYYHVSKFDSHAGSVSGQFRHSEKNCHSVWKKSGLIAVDLKGVDWSYIKKFSCTFKT